MQFGIFTIADITPDPTTGKIPTENERLRSMVEQGKLAEQVGWTSSRSASTTTRPS